MAVEVGVVVAPEVYFLSSQTEVAGVVVEGAELKVEKCF